LETAFGKPHSSNGFGNKFKDWCVEAGLPALADIEAVKQEFQISRKKEFWD